MTLYRVVNGQYKDSYFFIREDMVIVFSMTNLVKLWGPPEKTNKQTNKDKKVYHVSSQTPPFPIVYSTSKRHLNTCV